MYQLFSYGFRGGMDTITLRVGYVLAGGGHAPAARAGQPSVVGQRGVLVGEHSKFAVAAGAALADVAVLIGRDGHPSRRLLQVVDPLREPRLPSPWLHSSSSRGRLSPIGATSVEDVVTVPT